VALMGKPEKIRNIWPRINSKKNIGTVSNIFLSDSVRCDKEISSD
jgi:hypothetical protein